MSGGTVELRRPRVRGLEQRFESAVLPLFVRRTKEVGELLPELYLHGLAEGMLTGCGNRKGDTVASFIRQDQGACRHGEEEHRRRGGVKGLLPDS